MSARAPAATLRRQTTTRCTCACATHPQAPALDAELRALGSGAADGQNLKTVALRFGLSPLQLSVHRTKHLGLPPLPKGRPAVVAQPKAEEQDEPRRPPLPARREPPPLPPGPEGKFAQLVKTVATLVSLGSYRGLTTVRALAARHGVPEEEVLRAHRRAALSVRDARGGLREQLELSLGVLTQIRDQERQVADDYTGIARRIADPALPGQDGSAPRRRLTQEELDQARTARAIAAQAQDCAVAAQKQIDQNTIHRRTAPLVQVSFSASKEFTNAQEALVLLLCAVVGDERAEEAKAKVARGLQVLEDAGENLDAPEFLEYLAELRADSQAIEVAAE